MTTNSRPGSARASALRAVRELMEGNQAFVESHGPGYFAPLAKGQQPLVTLVACSDSRVQPEVLLPDATGQVFVVRNIGNKVTTAEGSIDFGVYHLKTPLLLILGHSDCGAVKAVIKGYSGQPEGLTRELNELWHALPAAQPQGEFAELHLDYILRNIHYQVRTARDRYAVPVREGALTVVGACYDFTNDLGQGHGRLVIVNVDGETDPKAIAAIVKAR